MAPSSCAKTASPAPCMRTARCGATLPCGAAAHDARGGHRRGTFEARAVRLVRSAARPHRAVPRGHVGTVLVLRHARNAHLLHDEAVAAAPADRVAHLRALHRI